MRLHLKRAFSSLFLLSLIFSTQSQSDEEITDPTPKFPNVLQYSEVSYQTDVVVTGEDEQISAFATEYYDASGLSRGRVDITVVGTKMTVLYDNETDQIIDYTASGCNVWDTTDSTYDYEPLFYGWLNKEPLIIGPTAPLWLAHKDRKNVIFSDEKIIRNINCDSFIYNLTTERDKVTFTYYFAKDDWKTPYHIEGVRVPIRIEVRGLSSKDSEKADQWEPINQLTDFAYFRPDIPNTYQLFEPPEGLGCLLKKNPDEIVMPKMPKKFKYTAEVIDLTQDTAVTDINYQQVWYDSVEKLARIDKYTKMRYTSQLSDFKTGVTYTNVDGQTCDITSLRNSFFEGYDGQMIGHLKEPGEVLGLDGTFYYLGKKAIRSVWCDVFESVKNDVTFMGKDLLRLVITIYYSSEFYEVAVEGETNVRVPVFYALKGWAKDETDKTADPKVVLNLHYNIFAFDDAIYPEMYASFRIGRCFPSLNDKSYFILYLSVSDTLAAKMEDQDRSVIEKLRIRIMEYAKVSNIRLPMLRADYKTTGVYVTGLMLDRPPALKQFWLEFEGDRSTNDPNLKIVPYADTKEKCAFACVDVGFDCFGFYFCNEACFLKSKDILEPDDKDSNYDFGGTCQEWLRAEKNSKNEPYLADALKSLEDAVLDDLVNITVNEDESGELTTVASVADIIIGDGPYSGGDQEKPYNMVISFAKLDPDDQTTEQISYIDNLMDCYSACKSSEDMDCSSFSYCPDSDNKQCSISSVLVVDRKNNPDDTVDDKNCYVYSMKFLDYYIKYPGRTSLIPGVDYYQNVKTVEDCARRCRQAKDTTCRGFEYCHHVHSCTIHTKHVLEFKEGEVDKTATCMHYGVKYGADYRDMGYQLLDDSSDVRSELSFEDCAKVCSEELKDRCQSFNYCPKSGPYMTDSSCELSTYTHTTDHNKRKEPKPPCKHYEKKENVDDWGRTPKNSLVTTGYTAGGFAWLVIGMLVLGLTLGAVGFVVYSYFRSRSASGDGMTVRFSKANI